ncbi:Nicastrin [Cooperia oncophora]
MARKESHKLVLSQGHVQPYACQFQLDGFGLIPEISPGEISVVTSVIALLAVVQAIGKNMDIFEQAALASNRHLLVAFFDGEAFDYIGSGSVAYDMKSGTFPRKPKNGLDMRLELIFPSQLDGIIEVQQLGSGTGERLYAHAHGRQVQNGQVMDPVDRVCGLEVTAVDGILVPPTEYSTVSTRCLTELSGILPSDQQAHSEVTMAASAMLRAAAEHVGLDSDTKSKLEIDKEFVSCTLHN